jgi:hypothetical protein
MLSAARRSFTTVADEVAAANLKGFGIFALKQTNDKGWGIFALSNIPRFTTVFKALSLARGPVRCSHSVQLDWDTHVQMDLPARFINHSCDANVGIVDNEMDAFDFVALRDLEVGQELTWDYGAAEFHSISIIPYCLCRSPLCRKDSLGFELAHRNIRQQYGKYYATCTAGSPENAAYVPMCLCAYVPVAEQLCPHTWTRPVSACQCALDAPHSHNLAATTLPALGTQRNLCIQHRSETRTYYFIPISRGKKCPCTLPNNVNLLGIYYILIYILLVPRSS